MESESLPQKEREQEPGPGEQGTDPPPETGADEVPPAEGSQDDELDVDESGEAGEGSGQDFTT